jgi:hypothetical protein
MNGRQCYDPSNITTTLTLQTLHEGADSSKRNRSRLTLLQPIVELRDRHGYGKTRGFRVTGHAGTGTVLDLAYPDHTAYPCHGIAGFDGYLTSDSLVRYLNKR